MAEKAAKQHLCGLVNYLRFASIPCFLGQGIRFFIRNLFPKRLLNARARAVEMQRHLQYRGLEVEHVFSKIYRQNEWGEKEGEFYSGSGSHNPNIVIPYVREVRAVLSSFPSKPVVVDLGSGDFNVGRHFVGYADRYYACDIVPELQEQNRKRFGLPHVEFLCLDIIEHDLPDGDVVFIRQVLQHLSNEHIRKVVAKCYKYHRWIITEHLPAERNFEPNVDIITGSGIRVLFDSGVVLTEPPFNVNGYATRVLCEVPEHDSVIRTTLFERNTSA